MLCETGGKFQFGTYEKCPGVKVKSYLDSEPHPFRVVEVMVDEDGDILLGGDDFTEEVWETEGIYDVVGDGVRKIAEAIRCAVRKDYIEVIDSLREEMIREIWRVIEAHKEDERCDCPKMFDEVAFKHRNVCEVDIAGYTYDVDEVKVDQWASRSLRLSIMSGGQYYTVFNVEEVAGILHAVRNTLDIPLEKNVKIDE